VSTSNSSPQPSSSTTTPLVNLGKTDLRVSPIGAGTWQWGGRLYWGYGRSFTDVDIAEAFWACVENGINWFDTAEIYGRGRSERLLGGLVSDFESGSEPAATARPLIATKFFPYPWRLHRSSLRRATNASLERLGTSSIDLYQIHFPFPPRGFKYWVNALADAAQDGRIKAVGVSNFSGRQVRQAHRILAERNIVLASNQIGYSLLNRTPESNGTIDACRELGVSVIAYGPLAEGLLGGKYGPGSPPPFLRRWRWARKRLDSLPHLLLLMKEIADGHGVSHSQVALNWLIQKGALPIPGVKTAVQATDNAAAMRWKLTDDEVMALDDASERL
jgi:aryl-alcohol dehydrogenase-like predicted oxidoreductase